MNVTLRQLRAFVNVARLSSFVAAARAMHVSAPALSILIGELEEVLGFKVFDRTTRRVRLSAAGEHYFPHAERVLGDLDQAERCALDLRSENRGVVRIATSQLIAWTLMPSVYAAFRAVRPDVRLQPLDLGVDEILPSLEGGRADLGITLRSAVGSELHAVPAFRSRMHLVCRAEHRWARRKRLAWAELAGEDLIFTGMDTPQHVAAALAQGPVLRAAWQVDHTGTALSLVASGLGSAVCAGYVRPMTAMHRLRMVPLGDPPVVRLFSIYTSRHRALAPAIEGFRSFVLAHFAGAGEGFVEDTLLG